MSSPTQNPAPVLVQMDRVLASAHFAKSPTLSRLLRFIVETTLAGKADELKEYRLGVDVFDRGADFDPRIDPIVRMQAARLRSRLAEYYADAGRADAVVITVPKGGYSPTFSLAPEPVAMARQNPDIQSIAVLPFVSMSTDPENEYFADGLTEELINLLTYAPGLRVVARTSVFCFKNSGGDIRDIGARLNVQTVLEGSVRRSEGQLRVTAQLIDVATGYHLLSRTFSRHLKEVFALQEELATDVVEQLLPHVCRDSATTARRYTDNLEAYNLYLQGIFQTANSFTGPQESIATFQRALELDRTFAPAWAGLAYSHGMLAWLMQMPARAAMASAKSAAQEAIRLDAHLGMAHASLGMVQAVFDWDWKGAERSFLRAIEIQPSLALAHQFYAIYCLMPQRRFEEAVAATERALLLNPFDPVLGGCAVMAYSALGDDPAALKQGLTSLAASPSHPALHATIALAHERNGRWDEAVSAHRLASKYSGDSGLNRAGLAYALAHMGLIEETEALLPALLKSTPPQCVTLALLYLGRNQPDEALHWFEKGLEEREPHWISVRFDPRFESLLATRPAGQLLERMGLAS